MVLEEEPVVEAGIFTLTTPPTTFFSVRDKLEISRDAPFNSDAAQKLGRRECTPNTRLSILREIISWAQDNNHPLLSSLFWIFGLAGTGKSTIAQSVCEKLEKEGLLASSYFCSLQLDSRNSKRIVPTIAYHLAARYPIFKRNLASKLREDPECAFARISSQFRDLLCGPWSLFTKDAEAELQHKCVVVIDALDECDNGDEVLRVILDAVDRDELPGIRFLATSRPVDALMQKALEMRRGPQIALHEVKKDEVSGDIRLFMEEQLQGKVEPATIHQLTARADGLFIFASTLVKHVVPNSKFKTHLEIQEKLRQILQPREGEKEVGLDALYDHILHDALSLDESGEDGFGVRLLVLQTVVCTEQATTAHVIADLLNENVKDIIGIVNSLHSVLFTRGSNEPIYVIHASFHDFIVSRAQGQFKCDFPSIHLRLSHGCLREMKEKLKFNICNIESSFTTNNDLPAPIDSIGEALAYASQHWWAHVTRCTREGQERMRQRISEMMEKKGLFWIEVMTLLGDERRCQNILTGISETSSMSLEPGPEQDTKLRRLAREAADLVSTFRTITPKMTSHIYLSVLSLWEGKHLEPWSSQFWRLPRVLSRKVDGSRNMKLIVNVESSVTSVAFSPDGKRVVSGSRDDNVQIWDAESGAQVAKIDGHGSSVTSVAFSPDGKRVVSGSRDHNVQIWDAESGAQVAKIDGHGSSVTSVAFSPDGKRVVFGSLDNCVRIWDADSGLQVAELRGHGSSVFSNAFPPDGKRVGSASWDKGWNSYHSLQIRNTESGVQVAEPNGHGSSVTSVAFSPDGKHVVSGSLDKSVRIWDADSGLQVDELNGHGSSVTSVAFSPDGKYIVSGSVENSVWIWCVESGMQVAKLNGHGDSVTSVAFSPSGKRVLSGSSDKSVRIWDTDSGLQVAKLDGHGDSVTSVAFSPDSKRVVSGSDDKSVRIWDAESSVQVAERDGHRSLVLSVAFSPEGKRVVSGSRDKSVRIWEAESGLQVAKLDGHGSSVTSVAFSPNGRGVVSGSDDKSVRIWDTESGAQVAKLNGHRAAVLSVAFSPDGKCVVSGSLDNSVRIWDPASSAQVAELDGHGSSVTSVAFSPDSKRIVSGSRDKSVRIWDAESESQVTKLDGHGNWVNSVAFSPDGKHVISGSDDKSVRIWDAESGMQIAKLSGHGHWVNSVAFSPDGKHVTSGSSDKSVRIWDAESGMQIAKLDGHGDSVTSVAFSPEGKRVVSGSDDKSVRIWDADFGTQLFDLGNVIRSISFQSPSISIPPHIPHLHDSYSNAQSVS
ncbi:WD40 repeat-like protein [Flagelloscypha sp. PMI_526]|nr:WD40 repeat-like protein [Flagelloscypha sp. PMI_526]